MDALVEESTLEELNELNAEKKSELAEAKLAELRSFRENFSSSLVPI